MESYGTREIVETWEKLNSGLNRQNPRVKPSSEYNIEDGINKLFEGINIPSFDRGITKSEHGAKDALRKTSMKQPMRIGFSRAVGIGISEPVNLKQALRGLCIAQASEMAAMKKKVNKPLSVSDEGAAKRQYKTIVAGTVETSKTGLPINLSRGNSVEVILVPENSKSLSASFSSSHDVGSKVRKPRSSSSCLMRPVSRIKSLHKNKLLINSTSIFGPRQRRCGVDNHLSCRIGDPVCQKPSSTVVKKDCIHETEASPVSSCASTSMEISSRSSSTSMEVSSTLIDSSSSIASISSHCYDRTRSKVKKSEEGSRSTQQCDISESFKSSNGVYGSEESQNSSSSSQSGSRILNNLKCLKQRLPCSIISR